ncbi:biopolymer transporter ExbD [Muribaculum caecicola]|jgi:biopolymer transport protein ExbD|uniref:Biopolymer transporter ExbD n=6 Tax=Muribaculum TaxID=1918540 RepID=A0AC61S8I6_9BACT|nr:biopolymer transporter ExbD [Muribaculum caecicola]THG55403.1 biopolymer transporter ExbD [Muribaculum caecicola]
MGKVKPKRKSTLIDMTAMSDVTVLLLTFFMLTSTFLQKEPVTVLTPSSVSELKVPTANLTTVLISPEGKVFLSISGDADSTYSSEKVRAEVFQTAVAEYNKTHSKKIEITPQQVAKFSKLNMFGYRLADLPAFLDKEQFKQDELLSDPENQLAGIPVDDNKDLAKPNEFQIWMRAIYNSSNPNLEQAIKKGEGIAIKADKDTPYSTVHDVLDNLQTLKMNKFSLMTALKTEND